jgi:hypothetical protein
MVISAGLVNGCGLMNMGGCRCGCICVFYCLSIIV